MDRIACGQACPSRTTQCSAGELTPKSQFYRVGRDMCILLGSLLEDGGVHILLYEGTLKL